MDPDRFKEVYRSKYGKVRIYQVLKVSKESKAWVANPANRICDAPGSWYCVGQYPPALHKLISRRKNFAQLEDFSESIGLGAKHVGLGSVALLLRLFLAWLYRALECYSLATLMPCTLPVVPLFRLRRRQ